MKGEPSWKLTIEGHTDSSGSSDYNLKLSLQRADAVKTWLLANGIEAGRLQTRKRHPAWSQHAHQEVAGRHVDEAADAALRARLRDEVDAAMAQASADPEPGAEALVAGEVFAPPRSGAHGNSGSHA